MSVFDLQAHDSSGDSYFVAHNWLALDAHPYSCHIQLTEATCDELISDKVLWRISVANVFKHVYVWSALFHKLVYSFLDTFHSIVVIFCFVCSIHLRLSSNLFR